MVRSTRYIRQVLVVLLMSAALWAALIASALAESITDFDVTIVVEENSDLTITERITYDFESAERHGIFREVLSAHAQPASVWYKTRSVEISPVSVFRNGLVEPFVDEGAGDMYLRIGDAGRTISGEQLYEINYRVRGAISTYQEEGLTELYWNVTGSEWQVPINNVRVTVRTAGQASLGQQSACYAGTPGSSSRCDSVSRNDGVAVFSEGRVNPGSQLTIAQSLALPQAPLVVERINWLPFLFGGLVIGLLSLFVYIFRWLRKYDPHQTIIAQYEPYEDYKPMFTGVILDGRVDSRDITAGIVYLAQQGFIRINQTEEKVLGLFNVNDYEVTLLRPFTEAQGRFQKDLLDLLFEGQAAVGQTTGFGFFKSLSASYRESAASSDIGKTIRLSDIKGNQTKLRSNYKLLEILRQDAKSDLQELGFYEQGLILSRRTRKGYAARNHLRGFKEFLSVTDAERYKFHNAPSKSPEQFMEYLPYAIAFGVEKEWAEVFRDIDIGQPDWYSSSVAGGHFNATDFTSDMSAFSGSLASSGSSGSSGGGSAGGGGGGGGGGSW